MIHSNLYQPAAQTARCALRNVISNRGFTSACALHDAQSHLPRVAQTGTWTAILPRFMRRRHAQDGEVSDRPASRVARPERREGITLIVLGLMAGSFAINTLALRREIANFSRKTEAKLELLREVIQRVRNGEDVDVKRLLGTGDPQAEHEWAEVMRELEETDMLANSRAKRQARRDQRQQAREDKGNGHLKTTPWFGSKPGPPEQPAAQAEQQGATKDRPKFMM